MTGIAAFALGLSAARAIKGQTWAGDNIAFEPVNPIEIKTCPLICVYSARGRAELKDRALIFAGDVRLRFEIFLPPQVNAGNGITLNTEAGQSIVFALIWRQIEQALLIQEAPWPHIYRNILLRTCSLDAERDLYEPAKGVKVPVAVYELRCETVADPTIGVEPSQVWSDFLTAMQTDTAELASLSMMMTAQIVGAGGDLPDWQVAMGALGVSQAETQAIDLGPLAVTEPASDKDDGFDWTPVTGAPVLETVMVPITPEPTGVGIDAVAPVLFPSVPEVQP
jgi:hypothetical protein